MPANSRSRTCRRPVRRPLPRRCALALCALLAGLSAHLPACAQAAQDDDRVVIEETRQYYDLDATDIDTLRRQLEARGPRTLAGQSTPGLTRHNLYMQYRLQPADGGCRIEGIGIETRIDIALPRWRPKHTPSDALRAQWPELERILAEHEQGHRDNGVWASHELLRRLDAIAPEPDCRRLASVAKNVRTQLLAELREREDRYDAATDHGRIQILAAIAARARNAGADATERPARRAPNGN